MVKMAFSELVEIVERNIVNLLKTFKESPATFLSECDVQCHLYSSLSRDPAICNFNATLKNFSFEVESSKCLPIHANMRVKIGNRDRICDFSIFQPRDTLDYESEEFWNNMIGIEIKFNRRVPARKEASNIIEDVKKMSEYKQGYVLWLNWDRKIDDEHLIKVNKFVSKFDNVKLFYVDTYSNPTKTNVREISDK